MAKSILSEQLIPSCSSQARRRSIRRKLIALLVSCGISGAFVEVLLRLTGVGFPNFYAPDFHCGSRLRSNTSGVWTVEGHGNIRINSLGFRGPEFEVKKSDGVFRICVLGDSFIEALQVDEKETFCFQLQKSLREAIAREDETFRVEVINCGVSGYGTAQQLLLLQRYVLPLKPDAVLLAIFPENDLRNNSRVLEGDETRPYFNLSETGKLILDPSFRSSHRWLVADSRYERVKADIINRSRMLQLFQALRLKGSATSGQKTDSESRLRQSVQESRYVYRSPESDASPEGTAWKVTDRLVEEIGAECQQHQVSLFAFTIPSPIQVWPDDEMRVRLASDYEIEDWFYAENRLQATCLRLDLPFYPLASGMQREAVQRRRFLEGFSDTADGIGHLNELGHTVAAEQISQWLMLSKELATLQQSSSTSSEPR